MRSLLFLTMVERPFVYNDKKYHGQSPEKLVEPSLFLVMETPLLNREGTTTEGTFVLLLKRAWV